MAKIDAFFNLMFEQKASDLHLSAGNPPMLRINGELHRVALWLGCAVLVMGALYYFFVHRHMQKKA